MQDARTRQKLLLVLVAGFVIRLALLGMPGTEDMAYFRMWGAQALRSGILRVYTWKDDDTLTAAMMTLRGIPFHPHTSSPTDLGPALGVPDYPPGNILVLEIATALCKLLQGGTLRAGRLLNACLNLPPVLFAFASTLALWFFARKEQAPGALAATAAFWLNPALILTSPVLGLQDPIFAFLGLLALIFAYRKRWTLSALFLAFSCLTKPQGIFLVPVLTAAAWAEGSWRLLARYAARCLFFSLLPLFPYILSGRILAPAAAIFRGSIFPALSAQTANVWWLVGPFVRALASHDWSALRGELGMVPQGEFAALAGFSPAWISLLALAVFTVANLYFMIRQLRAGNPYALFWAGALQVYGYTMLALFVHENHFYAFFVYAAPLLAIAPQNGMHRLYWTLSAVYGLNLFLLDGLGNGLTAGIRWLRNAPGFDLSIVVAVLNVLIFGILVRNNRWRREAPAGRVTTQLP
jgi:hypothetical protein